jgi:thiol-disulfide isomerase/thioredoxin
MFNGKVLSSTDVTGKLILLDFWEVWCGPCIESMPKIQRLYETYKSKGLNVYGITHDMKQLQSAKLFVKNQEIQFPMLIGNDKSRQNYKFSGTVPLYILIDKNGKVALVSEGYPPNLEEVIQSLL